MAGDLDKAIKLLDRFERDERLPPVEAERLLVEVFLACGHAVTDKGFVGGDDGVDCFVETNLDGHRRRIAVEVKSSRRPAGVESVEQAFALKGTGHFDRAMIVARSGFTDEAIRRAETVGLGQIDILGPADLRNWLAKHSPQEPVQREAAVIVRSAMAALAKLVAVNPEELSAISWLDLERLLGVAFEGLGFDVAVTRPAKDGGFDLELKRSRSGETETYLVEVKHWAEKKVGAKHLTKFVKVTASKQATGGLFLSTSGFSRTIYSGLTEFSAPVRLGAGEKVVAICKAYHRLESGLWLDGGTANQGLFEGTAALGQELT